MNHIMSLTLRDRLLERRTALQSTIAQIDHTSDLVRLLVEVDRALERVDTEDYGRCVVCDDFMDDAEMLENPQRKYCLCDLSKHGREELQRDLDLAWQVQASLLPRQNMTHAGWQTHFRYQPAGAVSGDYCDLIVPSADNEWLYFLTGDVSGKGVAASYVMAHLNALVRRTLEVPVPVDHLLETVNQQLSIRSSSTHFVTLVAGRAHASGRVEIANAGHCRPLVLRDGCEQELDATGIPAGILEGADYDVRSVELASGDSILLYTDGITEAQNPEGELYGVSRLTNTAAAHRKEQPPLLAAVCLDNMYQFRNSEKPSDDTTLMVLRYQ